MKTHRIIYLITIVIKVIFVISLIGCSNDSVDNKKPFGDEDFIVDQSEVIFTKAQRDAIGLYWWPDGCMGVINEGDGTYVFYAANGPSPVMTVGTLDKPVEHGYQNITISNMKDNDFEYCAGGPVYRLNDNTLLLIYHMEKPTGPDNKGFYSLLGAAVSTTKDNNGRFTSFRDLGLILSANRPYNDKFFQVDGFNFDIFSGGFAVFNEYIYIYTHDRINNLDDWEDKSQLIVARASISEINMAVNENRAPVFRKYYNGGFTEDGLGGKSSSLETSNHGIYWLDASYNSYLGKFLIVLSAWESHADTDLYLIVSDDGINWSSRMLIADEPGELFYPTIVYIEDEQQKTGKDFYVYYVRSIAGGWERWTDAVLVRRKITLNY